MITLIDCGVSLACNRGWKKISSPGGNSVDCPECGPARAIPISLTSSGGSWTCTVSGTAFPPIPNNGQTGVGGYYKGQTAMGAGWQPGLIEPQHSPSYWYGLNVLYPTGW